jgi:sugar lactone lactonase YvrE
VPGWIGVWSYDDDGDTAPRAAIRGPATGMMRPRGVALNPRDREIYVVDMARNTLFMFAWPEVFGGRAGSGR